jgi:hypothetical protein
MKVENRFGSNGLGLNIMAAADVEPFLLGKFYGAKTNYDLVYEAQEACCCNWK